MLAEQRLETILLDYPNYRDAAFQLEQVRRTRAQSTTPAATETPVASATSGTAIPTTSPTPAVTSSSTVASIDNYFNQADRYMRALLYEEAIEYLEIVRSLDPTYRENEVVEMLHTAKSAQALIYIREQNTGANGLPGDQLARGVQLGNEALALRQRYPWLAAGNMTNTDVYVAQQFLAAKRYVDAGRYDEALPVLNELCDINCGWGYRGTTVRELLNAAGGRS
jgi:tetratricopeptide (TPR) repeat protein